MGGRTGNQLRIIGGEWRSRRLRFADAPGLRPTPDRVRETLFNWLAPDLPGARCLDLFAGSGALGFEAASRGAAGVVLVERAAGVVRRLRENAALLDAGARLRVVQADALRFLAGPPEPFDILFLDPPYGKDLIEPALRALERGWLAPGAVLYLEAERTLPEARLAGWLPRGCVITRRGTAGEVGYFLARCET